MSDIYKTPFVIRFKKFSEIIHLRFLAEKKMNIYIFHSAAALFLIFMPIYYLEAIDAGKSVLYIYPIVMYTALSIPIAFVQRRRINSGYLKLRELLEHEPDVFFEANDKGLRFHIALIAIDMRKPIPKLPSNPIIEIPYSDIELYKRYIIYDEVRPRYSEHKITLKEKSKNQFLGEEIILYGEYLEKELEPETFKNNLRFAALGKIKTDFTNDPLTTEISNLKYHIKTIYKKTKGWIARA